MPWSEIESTPAPLLEARLDAIRRRRARERHENAVDRARSNDIVWGQGVEGVVPKSKATYRITDTPFRQHLAELARESVGLPAKESPEERQRQREARWERENKRMLAAMTGG